MDPTLDAGASDSALITGPTLPTDATDPSCPTLATPTDVVAWDHGERKSGAGLSGAMSSDVSTTDPTVEPVVSIAVASDVITLDWKKRSGE